MVNLDRRLVICRNAPSSVEPVAGEDPRHALVRSRAREADGTFVGDRQEYFFSEDFPALRVRWRIEEDRLRRRKTRA